MESSVTGLDSPEAKRILKRLNQISGGKVLDVGTEEGEFVNTLINTLKAYDSFTGIDITNKYFEKARNKFEDYPVGFMEMNAEALEFDGNSFDTVCTSYSIHHLDHIDEVLNEMKRVLKPNGYFLLQECYCDGEQTEAQQTDILVHHWSAQIDALQGMPHKETLSKQELRDIVDHLGLREVETFDSPHPFMCLFCERRFECNDRTHVNDSIKEIDDILSRAKDLPEFEKFKKESEILKKRVKEFGVAQASVLFFIGKK